MHLQQIDAHLGVTIRCGSKGPEGLPVDPALAAQRAGCKDASVSPVSRGRKKSSGRVAHRRRPAAEEDRLAGELALAFRGAASEPDPLVVEEMASDVLGMVWQQTPRDGDPDGPLIALAAAVGRRRDPASLALLRALATLGPSESTRARAAAAAETVAAKGVPEPPWSEKIGRPKIRDCWQMADVFGDMVSLLFVFAYGRRRHAVTVLVDLADGNPWAKDVLVVDQAGVALRHMRAAAAEDAPLAVLERVDPAEARQLLEPALAATDQTRLPEIPETYIQNRALALARCRALPQSTTAGTASAEPVRVLDEEREAVVADFLASPEAATLPAGAATRRCARLVVDFGADVDSGRLLRVSPGKLERFLHDWLPAAVVLDHDDHLAAMPAVVSAWARWAGGRSGLPPEAVAEVAAVADECGSHFRSEYENPVSVGQAYLAGLELTGGLEDVQDALDRRIFAMPYVGTRIGGEDYPQLDPADPDDRRLLIEGEHPEYHQVLTDPAAGDEIGGVNPRLHLSIHEIVANQLWEDDPPEVWQAARRLRDRGLDRHEILHRLMSVAVDQLHGALTSGTAADTAAYARGLDRIAAERKRAAGQARVVRDAAGNEIFVLKVSLRGAKPPIWRRLRVPARATLDAVHEVLQVSFGWTDSHLHVFESAGRRYSARSSEATWGEPNGDESRVRLADLLGAPGDRLRYEYDFGDSWEHDIMVEQVVPGDGAGVAVCVGGRRAGPPEDCGGVWGYAELCAILADPRHPEHDERMTWIGGRIDPARFDPQEVNSVLRRLPIPPA